MKLNRLFTSRVLLSVVLVVLIGALVVVQGTALNSSAASNDVTRQNRPHPKSHIKITDTATAIESDSITLYPRPHPRSHITLVEPGSALNPRPHPKSHIRLTATATLSSQP